MLRASVCRADANESLDLACFRALPRGCPPDDTCEDVCPAHGF
jgi:hypothetical protein